MERERERESKSQEYPSFSVFLGNTSFYVKISIMSLLCNGNYKIFLFVVFRSNFVSLYDNASNLSK